MYHVAVYCICILFIYYTTKFLKKVRIAVEVEIAVEIK